MKHRSHSHRRWFTGIALSALVAGSAVWFFQSNNNDNHQQTTVNPASQKAPAVSKPASKPVTVSKESWPGDPSQSAELVESRTPQSLGDKPFASSLEGTDIDGALKADGNGQLIVDLETRDFFDYFMNTVGEVPPEVALEQIRSLAYGNLPETAAQQAMELLEQYLSYKEQAFVMQQHALDPSRQGDPDYQREMLHQAFAQLRQIRQSVFSADVHQAFFGLEEAYGDYTLATIDLASREDLTPEAKTALADWHRSQLPEPLRVSEQEMLQSQQENRENMDIIEAAGSSEEAGRLLMAKGMDSEAAAEVTSYLKEREDFDKRFSHFQDALSQLETSGLAPEDEASQREQLIQRHFPDQKLQTWARLQLLSSN